MKVDYTVYSTDHRHADLL